MFIQQEFCRSNAISFFVGINNNINSNNNTDDDNDNVDAVEDYDNDHLNNVKYDDEYAIIITNIST